MKVTYCFVLLFNLSIATMRKSRCCYQICVLRTSNGITFLTVPCITHSRLWVCEVHYSVPLSQRRSSSPIPSLLFPLIPPVSVFRSPLRSHSSLPPTVCCLIGSVLITEQ